MNDGSHIKENYEFWNFSISIEVCKIVVPLSKDLVGALQARFKFRVILEVIVEPNVNITDSLSEKNYFKSLESTQPELSQS